MDDRIIRPATEQRALPLETIGLKPNLASHKNFRRLFNPPTPPPTLPALQNTQFFKLKQEALFPRLTKHQVKSLI